MQSSLAPYDHDNDRGKETESDDALSMDSPISDQGESPNELPREIFLAKNRPAPKARRGRGCGPRGELFSVSQKN